MTSSYWRVVRRERHFVHKLQTQQWGSFGRLDQSSLVSIHQLLDTCPTEDARKHTVKLLRAQLLSWARYRATEDLGVKAVSARLDKLCAAATDDAHELLCDVQDQFCLMFKLYESV